jgi:hypothetical protein
VPANLAFGLGTASRRHGILSKVTPFEKLLTPRISCVRYQFEFACKAKAGSGMHSQMYQRGGAAVKLLRACRKSLTDKAEKKAGS